MEIPYYFHLPDGTIKNVRSVKEWTPPIATGDRVVIEYSDGEDAFFDVFNVTHEFVLLPPPYDNAVKYSATRINLLPPNSSLSL